MLKNRIIKILDDYWFVKWKKGKKDSSLVQKNHTKDINSMKIW